MTSNSLLFITSHKDSSLAGDAAEALLITRAAQGNSQAIDCLVSRYRIRAVRLATNILRNSGEAEDAAQEAFIRAFQNLNLLRRDGSFCSWLYQIVVRICLDRRRSARWRSETPVEVEGEFQQEPASPTSSAGYEDAELRITVERLLARLNPQMRAMVVLRELDGLEYSEIAEVVGIPVGRVKWRLHEARKQFRTLWEDAAREKTDVS